MSRKLLGDFASGNVQTLQTCAVVDVFPGWHIFTCTVCVSLTVTTDVFGLHGNWNVAICKTVKSARVARAWLDTMLCLVLFNGVLLSLSTRTCFSGVVEEWEEIIRFPADSFTCLSTTLFLSLNSYLTWRFPAVTLHEWFPVVLCMSEVRGCVTVNGRHGESIKNFFRLSTPAVFRDGTRCSWSRLVALFRQLLEGQQRSFSTETDCFW